MATVTKASDRRSAARRRTLLRGTIILPGGFSTIRCTVLDLSEGGARLQTRDSLHLPDRFEFRMDGGASTPAELVRGNGLEVSIRFLPET